MTSPLRIRTRDAYDGKSQTFYPIVVIGAGASGIATACRLKERCGFDQFRIFDRQAGIGGTWWSNRYPGVACDVPTFFYSFSFAPNYLSKTIFPSGRDYVEYLYSVVERVGIADKIQLNAEVTSVEWIEQDSEWELQISYISLGTSYLDKSKREDAAFVDRVEIIRAKVVVSAVGILVEPNDWPTNVKGREAFNGQVIHSARWPAQTNLDGKDVVLVGSGCSAAQIAPALLKTNIKSLTQIIRTPPWLVPRVEEPGGKEAYAKWAPHVYGAVPLLGLFVRILLCWLSELLWYTAFQYKNVKLRQQAEGSSLAHMRALAPGKYQSMLTPTYSLGCKRRVFDNDWLRSMSDSRFTLINRPLLSADGNEIKVGGRADATNGHSQSEEVYRADTLILATGFEATQFLQPVSVIGRQGLSLHGLWSTRGGPHAYMGTALDGFPNFFMIMGPNTFVGHTSVIMSIENSVEYALRLMQPVLMGDVEALEPTRAAVQTWINDIRRDMKKTVFEGCQSWYNGYGVYNSVMYPRSQLDFYRRCRSPRLHDWACTMSLRGRRRQLLRRITDGVVLGAIAIIAFRSGVWIHDTDGDVKSLVTCAVLSILDAVAQAAQSSRTWITERVA